MLRDYYDHETFRMVYILVISTLGNLLNRKVPIGILGYRNERTGPEHRRQFNFQMSLVFCCDATSQ
jgi:hypothetical protein